MEKPEFTIRPMTFTEIESIAVEWAAREGWNPGVYDASSFYVADPKGFYVGMLADEPVACISAVAYDDRFAFVGFYIVRPEYRGRGYGWRLWSHALFNLKTQNVGLDGVLEQQPSYFRSGFKLAYRNIRYEGLTRPVTGCFPELIPIVPAMLEEICEYDVKLFPTPRMQFLSSWLSQPGSFSVAVRSGKRIVGYGMIRKCRQGYKIGPLFADTGEIAGVIFEGLIGFPEPGTVFYFDTSEVNPDALAMAERYGMRKVFETARMYTKEFPTIDLCRVFGVTSFELG